MAEVSVKDFAGVVGISVDKLLNQLEEAGVSAKQADGSISDDEKTKLLAHLRQKHGKDEDNESSSEPKQVTLKRKSVSELNLPGARTTTRARTGGRTVSIEVRKKRTYVKRSVIEEEEQKKADEEQQKRDLIEAEKRAEEEAVRAAQEEKAKAIEDAEAKIKAQEEASKKAEEEVLAAGKQAAEEQRIAEEKARVTTEAKAKRGKEEKKPKPRYGGRSELHVAGNKAGRRRNKPTRRRAPIAAGDTKHGFEMPTESATHTVEIPENISVADLAKKMSIKSGEVLKVLMNLGTMATINQVLDQDTAILVVEELGHAPKPISENALEEEIQIETQPEGELVPRSPVVTIMGHVDHGKTSLLDYIRSAKVADGEAGGITQHIGAYHVKTSHGEITFLDTPGHAAFTAMRSRGANSTDIVILVVAADDGVMPQTVEAVQHSKAAGVPMIVAVNKMDKEGADPDRAKNELSTHEVIPEDWGGDTQFIPVSAHTGEGVEALLDAVLLQAELLELKAPVEGSARGIVVESRLDKGRGSVATILVQAGTLKKGDILLAGEQYGRVRALIDEHGTQLQSAGPSIPVEVLGLSGASLAGDEAMVVKDERQARELADHREHKTREIKLARQQAAKLDQMFSKMEEGEVFTLNVLIKADVHGSAEALSESLTKLNTEEVRVNVVASGVGGINESDATLAMASQAVIIGFNVRADGTARKLIEDEELDLRYYSVIYDVIDDVKAALSGMLSPEIREEIIGVAEVKDVFRSSKLGAIAGCIVATGTIKRSSPIRVLRDNVVVYEGELESLRRFKDDVNEVKSGTECGIGVKNYNDIKSGDQIEVFDRTEVARSL
ncbi:MAG: translation initiation factor IF-2 [Gammaproteobacteria bacterium]